MHQTGVEGRWRWDEATAARYFLPGQTEPWIVLHTKRPEGLIAVLNGPKGFDPGSLKDTLPMKMQITSRGNDQEQIQIAFTELQQPRDPGVKKILAMHCKHVNIQQTAGS